MNQIYIRGNEIATKAYVDSLSLGGDGSALENYYTKEEVNDLIESSDGGNVDLSNYYTKEEINNVIAEINNTIQKETMPDPSEDNVGTIIQYIGDTNEYYTNSHFYQVVEQTIINEDGTETTIYVWEEIVSPEADLSNYYTKEEINNIIAETNNSTQVEEMPEASADNKGTIVQYIGDTNNTYTTGYFYQVVEETIINEDGTETIIYKWEEIKSPEINLEDYATKKYVDDAVAANTGSDATHDYITTVYNNGLNDYTVFVFERYNGSNTFNEFLNSNLSSLFAAAYNKVRSMFESGNKYGIIINIKNSNLSPVGVTRAYWLFNWKGSNLGWTQFSLESVGSEIIGHDSYEVLARYEENGDLSGFSNISRYNYQITGLGINNTTEYTPTGDYNPATKKYVDDTIATSIAGISATSMEIATSLPTENISTSTIYLIKDETASTDTENIYNEYIYVNGAWENIGSTKTTVDLSNYYTKEETEDKITEMLSNREPSDDNQSSGDLSNYYTKEEIDNKGYITSSDANSTYVTQNNFNTLQQTVEDKANATDVYTKEETNQTITDAIADVKTTDFQTATTLPAENISTNTIYLINKEGTEGDVYEEYIYINNKWEKIGETTVDLSQYSTTEEMNEAIAAEIAKIDMSKYLTSTEASNIYATKTEISNMYSKTEVNTAIENAIKDIEHPTTDLSNYYNKQEIDTMIGNINSILDAINGEEV